MFRSLSTAPPQPATPSRGSASPLEPAASKSSCAIQKESSIEAEKKICSHIKKNGLLLHYIGRSQMHSKEQMCSSAFPAAAVSQPKCANPWRLIQSFSPWRIRIRKLRTKKQKRFDQMPSLPRAAVIPQI